MALKPSARRAPNCTRCRGFYRDGGWQHNVDCVNLAVLWDADNPRGRLPWPCPWKCQPVKLAHSRTHHWGCPFWNQSREVPF